MNMNSGSKDGRSFRESRTSAEEAEAIQMAIPYSTRYKNKWAVDVFKEWQYYRETKRETSDEVNDNLQSVGTSFEEMYSESMSYWLGKFIQEVVKKNGERYPYK